MTKEEKIKALEARIKELEEEGDEEYLKYVMRIKNLTINMNEGSFLVMQSGNPAPPPPYVPPK